MIGCFPMASSMHTRMRALGYREIALTRATTLGPQGLTLRGHEFHYSALLADGAAEPITTVYRMTNRAGLQTAVEGYQIQRTLGSYVHVHWGSCPGAAHHLVQACRAYRQERTRHET